MGKISEIMLLKQPEQFALTVEVRTDMKGMSKAIGENFIKIDSLFKEQGEVILEAYDCHWWGRLTSGQAIY